MTIENVNIVRTSHYQSMSDHPPAKRPYGGVPSEERQRQRHDKLIDAGVYISEALGREPNSRASKAIRTKRAG